MSPGEAAYLAMIVVFFGVFCAAMAYGSWVAGERPSEPPGNQAPGV
jgi:hypothetical protein